MSPLVVFLQVAAVVLSLASGWLLIRQRARRLSVEFIAPTWRRLATKHGWRFIDGTFGVDSRLEGSLKGYSFTARAQVEEGKIVLCVPLHHASTGSADVTATVSSFTATDFMSALTDLVAQAREHDEVSSAPWSELAAKYGLLQSTHRGMRTLRGEAEGRAVRIGTQSTPSETVIRVAIGAPWPADVLIQPRSAGSEPVHAIGNPILDGLVTVTGAAAGRVCAALRDPRVAEDLIAVLHPYPRSSVVGGHVQMHCPGRLEAELPERLADALALAGRLQAAL